VGGLLQIIRLRRNGRARKGTLKETARKKANQEPHRVPRAPELSRERRDREEKGKKQNALVYLKGRKKKNRKGGKTKKNKNPATT